MIIVRFPLLPSKKLFIVCKLASIYRYLRFLPSSHSIPLHQPPSPTPPSSSPYKIFYNVYKPSTPFKKTAPPLPDFQVVVIKYVLTILTLFHSSLLNGNPQRSNNTNANFTRTLDTLRSPSRTPTPTSTAQKTSLRRWKIDSCSCYYSNGGGSSTTLLHFYPCHRPNPSSTFTTAKPICSSSTAGKMDNKPSTHSSFLVLFTATPTPATPIRTQTESLCCT